MVDSILSCLHLLSACVVLLESLSLALRAALRITRSPKKHLKNFGWRPSNHQPPRSQETMVCLHWIPICEGWNKRLIVGIYLRKWSVPESILELSKDYENEIEELEHMFQHRSFPSAIRRRAVAVDNARHALANELYRIGFVDPSDSSESAKHSSKVVFLTIYCRRLASNSSGEMTSSELSSIFQTCAEHC